MAQQVEILDPETQCPQKPRGRKPKSTRPSAAACGFNTEGMTDEQVLAKLESLRKQTETVKEEGKQKQPSRKKPRGSKTDDTAAESKDKENASGTEVKKPRGGRKKLPLTEVEEDTVPKKVQKVRSSGKKHPRTDEVDEDKAPQKVRKVRSSGKKDPPTEPDPQKVRRNAKKRSGSEEGDEKAPGKKARRSNKAEAKVKATKDVKKKDEKERASRSKKVPQVKDDDEAAAERKRKNSRKSSAYHAAKKAAKNEGLSEDQQLEAARKVPEQTSQHIFILKCVKGYLFFTVYDILTFDMCVCVCDL